MNVLLSVTSAVKIISRFLVPVICVAMKFVDDDDDDDDFAQSWSWPVALLGGGLQSF